MTDLKVAYLHKMKFLSPLNFIAKSFKRLLILLFGLLLLFVIAIFAATKYVETHKKEIFSEFEDWYAQHHNGTVKIGDIKVSPFSNLPNVSFEIDGVQLIDSLYDKHQIETLNLERLSLVVSLRKLIQKEIQFKEIQVDGLDFKMITSKDGDQNHALIQPKADTKKPEGKHSSSWFSEKAIKIEITNSAFLIENHQKKKLYDLKIKALDGKLDVSDTLILADLNMDIFVNQIAFNTDKGSYFNGARLQGTPKITYYTKTKELQIPFYDFKIGAQTFNLKTEMNFDGDGKFHITLNNKQTSYEDILSLIPKRVVNKLNRFMLQKPLETKAQFYGSFAPKSNPLVRIKLKSANNKLTVNDSIHIENLAFEGLFVNRLYDDKRAYHESVKDLRLDIDFIEADYLGNHVRGENLQYSSSDTLKNFVKGEVEITGKANGINNFINAKNMIFDDGDYTLNTSFAGDLTHIDTLLSNSKSSFISKNMKVLDTKTGLIIPIATLDLNIENENAFLNALKIALPDTQDSIKISGSIKNLTSLVFKGDKPVSTDVVISSEKLAWKDFQNLFKSLKKDNDSIKTQKPFKGNVMVSLLKTIERQYHPKIAIELGQYGQEKFKTNNLSTAVYFEGYKKLSLDDMSFDYKGGTVDFFLNFDIDQPESLGFSLEFITDKLPIKELLQDFDFFGIKALEDIEKLDGLVNLDVALKGLINEKTGLDNKSLVGAIDLDIENLEIKGFKPLEDAASKIFKKERFEDIKFAPITDRFFLKNETLEIPQLEMQSTAFDFFVEGHLSFKGENNIWVSVPLANLKHRDLHDFPEKVGYVDSGKKVFVEIKNNADDGKLGYHFHLTNKKLYEEKGMLSQYKKAHKSERKLRREHRRNERKAKHAAKHQK